MKTFVTFFTLVCAYALGIIEVPAHTPGQRLAEYERVCADHERKRFWSRVLFAVIGFFILLPAVAGPIVLWRLGG